jgi:Zn finger protein HypA/HybF involved in hydrogenase expression
MDHTTDKLDEALNLAVERGMVSAKCSLCKQTLVPESHAKGMCPSCGPFVASGEPQAVYVVPN